MYIYTIYFTSLQLNNLHLYKCITNVIYLTEDW